MAAEAARIDLQTHFFTDRERPLLHSGELSASLFRFESGVCAVRIRNNAGELIVLPFQGQQIWSARLGGRDVTMRSMFPEPRATQEYLETYGGFLLHCGATAMGVPGSADTHPIHGELPNAPFHEAYLLLGQDERGEFLAMGGSYRHTVAFTTNYTAEPLVKLYAGSTMIDTALTVTNLMTKPMEFMYLAHINFRPVDNGHLLYSARTTPEHVRVRRSIPAHVRPTPAYLAYIEELGNHPERHHRLSPEMAFDPEVVFSIDYLADRKGWAHTLQLHPDGSADYVRHRPDQLGVGVRWISRTGDQDALGLVLPATAEPEGYTAEKAKGNIKIIPAHGRYQCDYSMGTLLPEQASRVTEQIERILEEA